ncbi:MAG: helix-turn-helix transcriptional regulator [Fermentimonas sp.]|jgi:transcriptional regulator with XRE-family HTH domain|nr:helix-turn-helix transcriptional regulator [Fermentimonas sp.]
MTTSDIVRELCKKQNISLAEVARRIGQSPQNFNKKLKRNTLTYAELSAIADALGVNFELAFTLPDGEKITVDERSEQAYDD